MIDLLMGILAIIALLWFLVWGYRQALSLGTGAVEHDTHFSVHTDEEK